MSFDPRNNGGSFAGDDGGERERYPANGGVGDRLDPRLIGDLGEYEDRRVVKMVNLPAEQYDIAN